VRKIGIIKIYNDIGAKIIFLFQGNSNIILMFHSISEFKIQKNYSISSNHFYKILNYLTKRFKIVDLPEILENEDNRKKISLTFDDGYQNFYYNALPIIREFKVPVTLFICSSFIGNQNSKIKPIALGNNEDIMSENQISEAINSGLITIGNHTKTHPDLRVIDNDKRLKEEIIGGKKDLEKIFNVKVNRFSYPYGFLNLRSLKFVKKTHKYAVCGTKRVNNKTLNPYLLQRINGAQNWISLRWNISNMGIKLSNNLYELMEIVFKISGFPRFMGSIN
jgi:peptidoglycan/xylan/chitin deacetylase (PgdA/CDA1 family)